MPFEPFGVRFDIATPLLPPEAKAAIRRRKKGWFASKHGARGWIVGPLICLWLSAFDSQGPMLFGRIAEDGIGTRISGRAGSDLNGVLAYLLLVPALAYFLFDMIMSGAWEWQQLLIIGGLIAASPFLLWWSHKDRKAAEPLVRFVEQAVDVSRNIKQPRFSTAELPSAMTLEVNGEQLGLPLTAHHIHRTLLDLDVDDFALLEVSEDNYVFAARNADDAFEVEWGDGDPLKRFHLARDGGENIPLEDVLAVFMAYASGTDMPPALSWKTVEASEPPSDDSEPI